ncbi:MAG: NADH-quinone oxidoreductase subunit N [Ignavibacteria bacterium CG_4_8_14_3_um_filter_37_9]|nr:NADH-quinone oxidoreductase subunit N [Ignavibacteria bacterium]PIP76758.1 MAG: NADH-quinone oxidoreductase subunit N [Ignavibacteria bacterium CG22_combo_CG10-13_8_21_14_all_37_15]PIS44561.1 MAG: NADH-quinone oxidoreductase subunit N [Ignavibacteria bacterium CG08_land_8_20_14_0_20_37_9]PIX00021.1 MAG: NADH-quinone oxidoreductase subunit N [Ignavibacteria bacterium CG_4_8_14_3_um_filter_37_9]PIX93604.1 MAG: NADH-quinone oxidoreductase subunit N [Ignavibacteria bacterium CG_4_10_14_3_um_filt
MITPLLIISGGILLSLIVEMFYKKSEIVLPWISIALFVTTAYYSLLTSYQEGIVFSSMLAVGGLTHLFYFIFNFGAAIVVLLSIDHIKKVGIYFGEFYILMQSAVLGMMLLASAKDLVIVFIGLEQMSVCFYILTGFNRKSSSSNEAALKYFLLGAFASGFVVYGMALIYGSVGSLSVSALSFYLLNGTPNIIFVVGLLLFIIGFSFKIAAVPFHMWVPDVYQGAPTTVTALMSTGGKAAAFSALLVVLIPVFANLEKNIFIPFLSALAVLTMLYGAIVALSQTDLKRMLAYSSIAHAGYMIVGLASANQDGATGIVFYLAAYTFMNLGAFGVLSMIESKDNLQVDLQSYTGLAARYPLLAALMSIFMFSLAGVPPFAGFFGKYFVFVSAIEANLTWLAIIGVLSSAISAYFYLRVVVVMYFKSTGTPIEVEPSYQALLGIFISALLVIVMGVFPNSIIQLISFFVG